MDPVKRPFSIQFWDNPQQGFHAKIKLIVVFLTVYFHFFKISLHLPLLWPNIFKMYVLCKLRRDFPAKNNNWPLIKALLAKSWVLKVSFNVHRLLWKIYEILKWTLYIKTDTIASLKRKTTFSFQAGKTYHATFLSSRMQFVTPLIRWYYRSHSVVFCFLSFCCSTSVTVIMACRSSHVVSTETL